MDGLSDRRPTTLWLFALWTVACSSGIAADGQPKQESDHVVIDGANLPFDKTIEVVGPCLTTDSFELRFASASLLGLRIEGRTNQENIEFHLLTQTDADGKKLDALKNGTYYKVRGRITAARMSGPSRICNFKVEHIEAVPAAPLKPEDFVGRVARFEGVAAAKGTVQVHGETLHLAQMAIWPENIEGKWIEVQGSVMRDEKGWQLSMPKWKLIDLADMVGQEVSLDGTLWSLNGHWWFEYRDERLYLTSDDGPVLTFADEHGRTATVNGKLVRQSRPSLNQISLKSARDLVQTYVIRGARLTFRDDSATWNDRFGTIYPTRNKVRDGVPELLAESSFRRNLLGNETKAMLFAERNHEAISGIVHDATPAVRDVLSRRMNDAKVAPPLRLLYAAILARVNDERGREYLSKSAESPGEVPRNEIYYCLGIFPFLTVREDDEIATDCAWAEKTLVTIMAKPDTAEVASQFSSIPVVLCRINSPAARKALLDCALKNEGEPQGLFSEPSVTALLCHSSMKLPAKDLLRLEAVTKDQGTKRIILRALLRLKHPAAAERFLADLKEGFVYMDFRDLSSREVLAALKPKASQLTGETKSHVELLLILGEEDPVPALLSLLNDAKFPDKNLLLFELARIADSRAVSPVARVLREAPKDYFGNDSELSVTAGIEHALEALAKTRTRDAVRELIELVGVDLGRFGGYIDQAGLQRIIAAHLIEITGESFGVDQAGWRTWEKAQPDVRFHPAKATNFKHGPFREGPDKSIDLVLCQALILG
jgi:hypothetical protein